MKWPAVVAMGACAVSCLASLALCRPQEPSIDSAVSVGQASEQTPAADDGPASATVEAPPEIWLGVGLKSVEGDLARFLGNSAGLFIDEVFPDSPAAAAQLQPGDILLSFNGTKLAGPEDLVKLLRAIDEQAKPKSRPEKPAADPSVDDENSQPQAETQVAYSAVKLTLNRQGREMAIALVPTSRPQSFRVTAEAADQSNDGASFFYFGEPKVDSLNNSFIVLQDVSEQVEKALKQLGHASVKIDASRLPEQLKKLGEFNGGLFIESELSELGDLGELSELVRGLAAAGAANAQVFLTMPPEIQSLQEQIVDLKKQVEELQAELNASKK